MNNKNFFANVYAESLKMPTMYGETPTASEFEVSQAYAEFQEVAHGMENNMVLYAEACEGLINERGFMGALLYAEAEGGFFKRIIDALVKVFNKGKDFLVKLLGRFKSDKAYRQDFTMFQSIAKSLGSINFNDNATISVKKARYGAITALIINILKTDGVIASGKMVDSITLKDLNRDFKALSKSLVDKEAVDKSGTATKDTTATMDRATTNIQKVSQEFPTTDMWLKSVYAGAISKGGVTGADMSVGDAKFGKNDAMTPSEAVGKLWDTATKNYKGSEIKSEVVTKIFTPVATALDYDKISKALETGVSVFTDQIDELKDALNEVENESKRVQGKEGAGEQEKAAAAKGASVAMQYSRVCTNYSVVATTAFNTAKLQLDRLVADMKAMANTLDNLRKTQGSTSTATA